LSWGVTCSADREQPTLCSETSFVYEGQVESLCGILQNRQVLVDTESSADGLVSGQIYDKLINLGQNNSYSNLRIRGCTSHSSSYIGTVKLTVKLQIPGVVSPIVTCIEYHKQP
jgi:hypothetical protein